MPTPKPDSKADTPPMIELPPDVLEFIRKTIIDMAPTVESAARAIASSDVMIDAIVEQVAERVRLSADGSPTPAIYGAMGRAMAAIGAVGKDGESKDKRGEVQFKFRGVDAVVIAVHPALRDAGIFILPEVLEVDYSVESIAKSSGQGNYTQRQASIRPTVRYHFVSSVDGSRVHADIAAEAIDYGDKGVAKALSVAYRTMLLQVFAIPTGDADPDEATYERGARESGSRSNRRAERPAAPPNPPPDPNPPATPTQPGVAPYEGTDEDWAIDVANTEADEQADRRREALTVMWHQSEPGTWRRDQVVAAIARVRDAR